MPKKRIKPSHMSHIICIDSSKVEDREAGISSYEIQAGDIIIARRHELEQNFNYRQLLPNAIFTHKGKVWAYKRTSTSNEEGLRGQASVCVGGHWDLTDLAFTDLVDEDGEKIPAVIDLPKSIEIALNREIEEEIELTSNITNSTALPFIFAADVTVVDRKHIGMVNIFELDGEGIRAAEDKLETLGFFTPEELLSLHGVEYDLETWAKMACETLIAMKN